MRHTWRGSPLLVLLPLSFLFLSIHLFLLSSFIIISPPPPFPSFLFIPLNFLSLSLLFPLPFSLSFFLDSFSSFLSLTCYCSSSTFSISFFLSSSSFLSYLLPLHLHSPLLLYRFLFSAPPLHFSKYLMFSSSPFLLPRPCPCHLYYLLLSSPSCFPPTFFFHFFYPFLDLSSPSMLFLFFSVSSLHFSTPTVVIASHCHVRSS